MYDQFQNKSSCENNFHFWFIARIFQVSSYYERNDIEVCLPGQLVETFLASRYFYNLCMKNPVSTQ